MGTGGGACLDNTFWLNISVIQCLKVKYLTIPLTMNVQRLRQERWTFLPVGWLRWFHLSCCYFFKHYVWSNKSWSLMHGQCFDQIRQLKQLNWSFPYVILQNLSLNYRKHGKNQFVLPYLVKTECTPYFFLLNWHSGTFSMDGFK